jgi:predicted nucleic acid-binding protein
MIARIILQPKSKFHFYSTDLLSIEIQDHKNKLKRLAGFSDSDLNKSISIITSKIRFINADLIPPNILISTQELLQDIDIDDTEFVALTSHLHGRLWSGDKVLQNGLIKKGWNKFISTNELYTMIHKI